MSKITSKYQVSIPKGLAEKLNMKPGDEIEWQVAGEELRVCRPAARQPLSVERRLELFDEATRRQAARNKVHRQASSSKRGWTREGLYDRGRSR